MVRTHTTRILSRWLVSITLLIGLILGPAAPAVLADGKPEFVEVIIQGPNTARLMTMARAHGGQVMRRLDIIDGVGVRVPRQALKGLQRALGAHHRFFENRRIYIAGDYDARVADGLLALYAFGEGSGSTVHDLG